MPKGVIEEGFPGRLNRLRTEIAMTQVELARLASCTDTAIRNYEGGKREPTASIFLGLARALGVAPEYLWFGRARKAGRGV